jgi:hypothetical protein
MAAAAASVARRLGLLFRMRQICPLPADRATYWTVPSSVMVSYNSRRPEKESGMGKAYGMAAVLFGLGFCISAAANDSVVTYHNGNHRHGAYTVPGLTLAAAANMQRDSRFQASISGHVYAQPLYWKPNGAKRGLVIVATESNNVYALNDTTGAVIWHASLGNSVPRSELPCGNIDPVGITGTPVIDPASATLYAGAMVDIGGSPKQKVFALSLADGSIVPNWPLEVESALQ